MVALTAYALGASGQVLSGRLLRHTVAGLLRQAGAGLQVVSGVLAGAPNTMGELTLVSNTQLTVQPFRAVIQNSQDLTAGGYVVPSETLQTFTAGGAAGQSIPAQDASQFRRALVVVHVDDASIAGSGANDALLEVLPGALAVSAGAAALPATPVNALLLGELLIPPTGQTVTLTPYNPRTGIRHGIQPAILADGLATVGHDGAPGVHDGQYRDHPTWGLERWNASKALWIPVAPFFGSVALTPSSVAVGAAGRGMFTIGNINVKAGQRLRMHLAIGWGASSAAAQTIQCTSWTAAVGATAMNPNEYWDSAYRLPTASDVENGTLITEATIDVTATGQLTQTVGIQIGTGGSTITLAPRWGHASLGLASP